MPRVTRTEYETVEATREVDTYKTQPVEVEYFKCSCCGQEWLAEGDVEVHELVKNPRAKETVSTFGWGGNFNRNPMKEMHDMLSQFLTVSMQPAPEMIGKRRQPSKHDVTIPQYASKISLLEAFQQVRQWDSQSNYWEQKVGLSFEIELPVHGSDKRHLCEFCYTGIFE